MTGKFRLTRYDEGRRSGCDTPPPSQTGQADFPHPAFQFVASDGLAQAPGARRLEAPYQPHELALCSPIDDGRSTGLRPSEPKRLSIAPTRTALRHYVGPCELGPFRRRPPRSYIPSLHGRYSLLRYYGRSDPDRPFRRRLPWFPDSRLSDFRPCCLQPPVLLPQPRSTPSALGALFCSGFALGLARSPAAPAESSSLYGSTTAKALRPGRSLPVALHPGLSPRCSYVRILALQCRPGQGLPPCCQRSLSGARVPASAGNASSRPSALGILPIVVIYQHMTA